MTGHGGWPLNVFLTPEQLPFYGGTYFPPDPRHGMPAWTQVLQAIAESWSENREEIRAGGERLRERLSGGALLSPSRRAAAARRALDRGGGEAGGELRRAQRRLRRRAEVPAGAGARVPAAARRARDGAGDAARDGQRWHPRPDRRRRSRATASTPPGRCRTSRRCSTTTRCSRAPTCTAGSARSDDAPAGGLRRHARVGAARDARPGGRLLQRAGRRLRGRRGALLRVDASPSSQRSSARTPARRSPGWASPSRATSRIPTIPSRA